MVLYFPLSCCVYSYTVIYPSIFGIVTGTGVDFVISCMMIFYSFIVFWLEWARVLLVGWSSGLIGLSQLIIVGFECLNAATSSNSSG